MVTPPTAHILCGLVGSGKTTVAKRIEAESGAVRFTLDEWALRIGGVPLDHPDYGHHAQQARVQIWEAAAVELREGRSVILDWSHWSREQRRDSHDRAVSLGAAALLHWLTTPLDEAIERIRHRNDNPGPGTHQIDIEQMREFSTAFFEPPSPSEGIKFVIERSTTSSNG